MSALKTFSLTLCAAALLTACGSKAPAQNTAPAVDKAAITRIMDAQPDKAKARFDDRNPAQTLAFFGIAPGMKVAEALPGGSWDGSWYTRIIAPYLGKDGHLSGVDYPIEIWSTFGGRFAKPEFLEGKKIWGKTWSESVRAGAGDNAPSVDGFTLSTVPAEAAGTYDAVLFIRAMHNMARFEDEGGYMTMAIEAANTMLKPGGIVGVVQHRLPEDAGAERAKGGTGYLKQSDVIAAFEAGGFKLAAKSEINANPKDVPGEGDIVWRLPPSLRVGDDEAMKAKNAAIGESDRMTLKFVKQ